MIPTTVRKFLRKSVFGQLPQKPRKSLMPKGGLEPPRAVAHGVPLPMGRAVAKAVKRALGLAESAA